MKKQIEVFDYANNILKAVKTGVLLTTKTDDKVNTMTISWGTLGIEWGKTIFTVFVRENRFTKSQLDKNPEFTINIPVGEFNKKILGLAGTKSGHDMDKIKEIGLTLEDGILRGGFGESIASFYGDSDIKVKNYGLEKKFYDRYNPSQLLDELGITPEKIVKYIESMMK